MLRLVFALLLVGAVFGDEGIRVKRYPYHLHLSDPLWPRFGECPVSEDGVQQHFCPTPTPNGKWVCIDDYQLCDGTKNCPNAEDESEHYCLFYIALKSQVNLLTRSIKTLGKDAEDTSELEVKEAEKPAPFVSRNHRQWGKFVPA